MRQLSYAVIVGLFGAAVLIGAAQAQAVRLTEGTAAQREPSVDQPAEPRMNVQAVQVATVSKRFGAAVRAAPSSDAPALFNAGCGDVFPVMVIQGGWVQVQTEAGPSWIGGGRVVVGGAPASVDCSDERFFGLATSATTAVTTGCLSLRARPSREAAMLGCVENGHMYTIIDGPFDPGTGEDWIRVSSPSTGTGWALAQYLYPPGACGGEGPERRCTSL